ncbi:MAG: hypothetical protein HF314_07765 [Ignavibacteria bacterium]|jgi:hypothetical protein|nr:hypothetical protein [Ignavibacteria bacterium]MCU7502954.1 hypothetical protein [Ignavibacteria bacterium]MCU7517063.1 hypothetical protein [Ignavibacteria bacterium]
MKILLRSLSVTTLLLISAFSSTFSQSLNDRLQQLSGVAANSYVAPAFNSFGANINGGWFTTPPKAKILGIDVEIGFIGMGSYFKDNCDHFSTSGSFRFSREQANSLTSSIDNAGVRGQVVDQIIQKDYGVMIYGPTITGSKSDHIYVTFAPQGSEEFTVSDPKYPFPVHVRLPSQKIDLGVGGVLDHFPMLPAATPQIKLGTVYGTQAIIRLLPSIKVSDDIGKLSFFGFGLQHNPAMWFNYPLPVDLSAGFFVQQIKVEDLLKINTTSFGLNVSKNFGFGWLGLTPYAGFMIENSKMNVSYSHTIDTDAGKENININFDMDGENSSRVNAGLNLRLFFVNLIADYNFSKNNSFTGGLLFNFGF